MRNIRQWVIAAAVGSFFTLSSAIRAELPPGAYEQLLKDAQDVVQLRIEKVSQTPDSTSDMQHFTCEATVLGIDRSKDGMKAGDKIVFRSYLVTDSARRRGWVGPQSPPRLQAGWTGTVYLNPPREGKAFELAAYGRSFVSARGPRGNELPPPPPAAVPLKLGVIARPAARGGLDIASAVRKTLADKLGLRAGDRLLEINGTVVNAVADFPAALMKNSAQLEVKIVRDGETVELTLKR